MWTDPPFLYYEAVTTGAAGGLLALRGLVGHRTRGRRLCPRCRYDLSAVTSFTCSECGHRARHEAQLRRARRIWPAVWLGLLLLSAAAALASVPRARHCGWWSVVPTTALIGALPLAAGRWDRPVQELFNRADLGVGTFWGWQKQLLARGWLAVLRDQDDPELRGNAASILSRVDVDWRFAFPVLVRLLDDPDEGVRAGVANLVGSIGAPAQPAVPKLTGLTRSDSCWVRRSAVSALGSIGPGAAPAANALIERIADPCVAEIAVWALGRIGAAGLLPVFIRLLDDERADMRLAAIEAIDNLGASHPRAVEALVRVLHCGDLDLCDAAAAVLGKLGRLEEAAASLSQQVASPDRMERLKAIHGLRSVGDAAVVAIPALRGALADEDPLVRLAAATALKGLGLAAAPTLPDLKRLAADPSPHVAAMAREAVETLAPAHPEG